MKKINNMNNFNLIQKVSPKTTTRPKDISNENIDQSESFSSVLEKQKDIKFSKHANQRINSRNLNLNNEQLKRIEEGVNSAKDKGIRNSLVMVDNLALLVNINSRTVVTAMESTDKNVFTNIDGAVIV